MTQPNQSTLSRKWKIEVNTGTVGAPIWTNINGLSSLTPIRAESNLEDDNVYEDMGYQGQTKTALRWHADLTIMRRTLPTDVTTYDPGQEKLRVLAQTLGPTGVGHFRIYDRDGGPEAWTGFAEVSWANAGGEMTDLESVDITLDGKGAPTDITNPNATALAVPTVTLLNPTTGTTAGGTLVKIVGDNFIDRLGNVVVTGAAGVKFAAANATSYFVESRNVIYAVSPANTAGSKDVIVTNTTGANVNTATDNFLYV